MPGGMQRRPNVRVYRTQDTSVGRFPQHFVEDLKAHADILQVVQDTVPLRKAGRTYKGLCPFHTEKTPSFHVNPEKGFFHCFGCGTGGDVVKFVELQDKLSFPEAVRHLAHRFGLQVPESDDPEHDAATDATREALLKVHTLASSFFREQLASQTGSRVRRYLSDRGILSQTIEQLGLGYAPAQRDSLKQHLLDAGQSLDLLLASGLVLERDRGQVVDRFRNRLMIPIHRDSGSVVAFGGRALEVGQQPKYVNSPETLLYSKSRTLYGLHLTKTAMRRLGYAVMVEGYFDFAQAMQAGAQTAVATCGTAVTQQQARLLRRFASKVIVSFDSDTAGQNAAAKTGELLVSESLQVNVAVLPSGEDPDTFVRKQGSAKYIDKLRTSQPYLDYVLDRAAASRDLSRTEQRRAFLTEMLTVAARIPDPAARDQFADQLAHRARIMEDVVRTEIRRAAVARRTTLGAAVAESVGQAVTPAEKGLIWALIRDTKATQDVLAGTDPADFETLATESILQVARTLAEWPADAVPKTLLERLNPDEAALVERIAQAADAPARVDDCATELRRLRFERERAALQDEINRHQQIGTPEALREIDTLWRRKKDLLHRIEALWE